MFCLGGFCPGGFWQGGFLSGGLCPGVFCPGGFCPRTGNDIHIKDVIFSILRIVQKNKQRQEI